MLPRPIPPWSSGMTESEHAELLELVDEVLGQLACDVPLPEVLGARAEQAFERARDVSEGFFFRIGNGGEGADDVLFDTAHAKGPHEARGFFVGHWSLLFEGANHARVGHARLRPPRHF